VVQGVQIGHSGSLGSVAGEPDRRQRQLLCLLRSPHKWLAPGRWGGARVRPIGRHRRCKYKPRKRVLHPVQLLEKSRDGL
jgi:hypothetical protein